jgi:ribosomal-protein-alanine N-acetyltransferase
MGPDTERTLISPRLALEPIEGRHAEALFGLLQDPSIYVYVPTEPPASVSALRERYEYLARRKSPDGREAWLNWAVRVQETGAYAGTIQATVRPDATALLAYELGAGHRGAGYATEACEAVIRELVDGHGVAEVVALVDTRNARSIRLLERLGFERTRHVVGADHFKGSSSDEYEYRWSASRRPPDVQDR